MHIVHANNAVEQNGTAGFIDHLETFRTACVTANRTIRQKAVPAKIDRGLAASVFVANIGASLRRISSHFLINFQPFLPTVHWTSFELHWLLAA